MKREESNKQMNILSSYLGIVQAPNENYPKAVGSCQWIETRHDFQDWRDSARDFPSDGDSVATFKRLSMFWAYANPGTGKTTLASHVISHLRESQLECAYYHFHAGEALSRSLSHCLRSICYQIASSNNAIRETLFNLFHDDSTFDMEDSWSVWSKAFKKGILSVSNITLQQNG
jgi:Cdc6-like AAA superfamily ATPase